MNTANAQITNINLNVQKINFYNGPFNYGIGMVKKFKLYLILERLGINSARLFVTPISNLRSFIGARFGQNLGIHLYEYKIDQSFTK
jgi:hypothetical protein